MFLTSLPVAELLIVAFMLTRLTCIILLKHCWLIKLFLPQQSLDAMPQFVREDDDFYTGVSIIKKITYSPAYGTGHTGRDLGYSADLFYFPQRNITMVFFVNYGINGNSSLKQILKDFESEPVDMVLK